jgi:hypothetical protein
VQAPTTPAGSPAQQPGERTCPSCGASNGALAAFCWQCYQQFGAHVASYGRSRPGSSTRGAAVPGRGLPGATLDRASTPLPQQRSGSRLGTPAGVVLAIVTIALVVFFLLQRAPSVALPASFGGLTRIQNEQVEAALDAFRTEADDQGFTTDMGVYGTGGVPTAALAWVTGADAPSTDDAFDEFAGGFNEGLGTGSLDEGRRTREVVEGVTYVCAPILGTPTASLCMWQENDVFWVLFDLSGSDMDATRDLVLAVHSAA